eukprot:CFRG8158T1
MNHTEPTEGLRICSLLPSSTEIVGRLGLHEYLVACTHCCNELPGRDLDDAVLKEQVYRVTSSEINPYTMSQSEIDEKVKTSLKNGLSLYQMNDEALKRAHPTVVLTQALCTVCATSYSDVVETCSRLGDAFKVATGKDVVVINLEPHSCAGVANTFVQVAEHCGVKERGEKLRDSFMADLDRLQTAVTGALTAANITPLRVYVVEWLDPPFDGGHWVPEQIVYGGCVPVFNAECDRSKQRTWKEIHESDIDVVVVACCGYDVEKNLKDSMELLDTANMSEAAIGFRALYAQMNGRVYVANGNRYFSRPGSSLVQGAALVARCAYDNHPDVCRVIEEIGLLPKVGDRLGSKIDGEEGEQVDREAWIRIEGIATPPINDV